MPETWYHSPDVIGLAATNCFGLVEDLLLLRAQDAGAGGAPGVSAGPVPAGDVKTALGLGDASLAIGVGGSVLGWATGAVSL